MRFAIFLFLSICLCLQAQQDCNQILVNGVMETQIYLQDQSYHYALADYVASLDYGQYRKTTSSGGGGSWNGLGLNANMSETQFNEWKRTYLHSRNETYSSEQIISMFKTAASPVIVNAWLSCLNLTKYGFYSHIEKLSEETVQLKIIWLPTTGDRNYPKVQNVIIQGGTFLNPLTIGQELREGINQFALTRDKSKDFTVLVSTPRGDLFEFIPKWRKVPPPTPTPTPTPDLPSIRIRETITFAEKGQGCTRVNIWGTMVILRVEYETPNRITVILAAEAEREMRLREDYYHWSKNDFKIFSYRGKQLKVRCEEHTNKNPKTKLYSATISIESL